MILGIVGHEDAKFTAETEDTARRMIRDLIATYSPTVVVSGGCHLGGIDIWAVEEAQALGVETKEFIPKSLQWSGPHGYKARNERIAKVSDVVVSLVVDRLPAGYKGLRFEFCYHCGTSDHVKSGGCWTAKYARLLGKNGYSLVVATGALSAKA